jgi:hypothetical protein
MKVSCTVLPDAISVFDQMEVAVAHMPSLPLSRYLSSLHIPFLTIQRRHERLRCLKHP